MKRTPVVREGRFPRTTYDGGSHELASNPVWNVPDKLGQVHGEFTHSHFPFASVRTYRALAIDCDGYVYGVRTLTNCRESGFDLEGQVSICGRKLRGFTSSKLFRRADRTHCDVAAIYVCVPDDWPVPVPNLDTAPDAVLEAIQTRYHYSRDDWRAALKRYADCVLWLRRDVAQYGEQAAITEHYRQEMDAAYRELPEWAKFRAEVK